MRSAMEQFQRMLRDMCDYLNSLSPQSSVKWSLAAYQFLKIEVNGVVVGEFSDFPFQVECHGELPTDWGPIGANAARHARSTVLLDHRDLPSDVDSESSSDKPQSSLLVASPCWNPWDRNYADIDREIIGALVGSVALSAESLIRASDIREAIESFAEILARPLNMLVPPAWSHPPLVSATFPWQSVKEAKVAPVMAVDTKGTPWRAMEVDNSNGHYKLVISDSAIESAEEYRIRSAEKQSYRRQFLPNAVASGVVPNAFR